MIPVPDNQIGGAIVRRRVDRGSLPALNAGDRMTREEVMAMPVSNRRALVNNETIWLSPREQTSGEPDRPTHKHKR